MNLYFLLEGDRTEKHVYRAWLGHVFPHLRLVATPEEMDENCVRMISGGGYPQYLRRLDQVLEEISTVVAHRVDHLFICVDAEESSFEEKHQEVESYLKRIDPVVRTSVIVQHSCIETWFLGNRTFVRSQPQSDTLKRFRNHFDVRERDPETMRPMPPWTLRALFHQQYLKEVFRERGLSYSKRRPAEVTERHYLDALIRRQDDSGDLRSFGRLVEAFQELGADFSTRTGTAREPLSEDGNKEH